MLVILPYTVDRYSTAKKTLKVSIFNNFKVLLISLENFTLEISSEPNNQECCICSLLLQFSNQLVQCFHALQVFIGYVMITSTHAGSFVQPTNNALHERVQQCCTISYYIYMVAILLQGYTYMRGVHLKRTSNTLKMLAKLWSTCEVITVGNISEFY